MITNCQKTHLGEDHSAEAVQKFYRNQLIPRVHQTKYEILFEEYSPKFEDPKNQLSYLVSKAQADYCFIGSFGRKGDQTDIYRVGKTAMVMSSKSKVPIVIVKDYYQREKNKSKGFNFACCIDGSKKSMETLKYAKDLARNPRDKV